MAVCLMEGEKYAAVQAATPHLSSAMTSANVGRWAGSCAQHRLKRAMYSSSLSKPPPPSGSSSRRGMGGRPPDVMVLMTWNWLVVAQGSSQVRSSHMTKPKA